MKVWAKFKNRKLIKPEGNEVSYLQLFGFLLIVGGIALMLFSLSKGIPPERIAVSFFITMLGVAFAFPSLLEGNEGLSTMRIVVFMITNVICLLLLKLGWNKNNLAEIGLDEWWMGVIAFVFGAKATQTYFESKLAVPSAKGKDEIIASTYSHAEIVQNAVDQNEAVLKSKFSNINSISCAVNDLNKTESHVAAIYLKDHSTMGIPSTLKVKMDDGITRIVPTQVIEGGGEAKVHIAQGNSVADCKSRDYKGSICCAVRSKRNPDFTGIVTSAHIFTQGEYKNKSGKLDPDDQRDVFFDDEMLGQWFYSQLNESQDLIIIRLDDSSLADDPKLKKFDDRHYVVSDPDVGSEVTILSRKDKKTKAYILDHNVGYPIEYENGTFYKTGVILIGNDPDRTISKPVSVPGDSGSCVFIQKENTDNLLGILLGSDENFTFVLPVKSTLSSEYEIV